MELKTNNGDSKHFEAQLKEYESEEWKKARLGVRNAFKVQGEKASKCVSSLGEKNPSNKIDMSVTPDRNYHDQTDTTMSNAIRFIATCTNQRMVPLLAWMLL